MPRIDNSGRQNTNLWQIQFWGHKKYRDFLRYFCTINISSPKNAIFMFMMINMHKKYSIGAN
jgi:hypothetical protein